MFSANTSQPRRSMLRGFVTASAPSMASGVSEGSTAVSMWLRSEPGGMMAISYLTLGSRTA